MQFEHTDAEAAEYEPAAHAEVQIDVWPNTVEKKPAEQLVQLDWAAFA